MPLNIGNPECTTGLARRNYENWTGMEAAGFSNPMSEEQEKMVKAMCFAFAKATVEEIQENGVVVVTIGDTTYAGKVS